MEVFVGQIVHYVLPDGPSIGECRPAVVVKVWGTTSVVNLQIFTDRLNDDQDFCVVWQTSVLYVPEKLDGGWHFIDDGCLGE